MAHCPGCLFARNVVLILRRVCSTALHAGLAGHFMPPGPPPPVGPPQGYSPGYYGPAPPPSHYPGFGSPPFSLPGGPPRPPAGPPGPLKPRPLGGSVGRYEGGPRDPAKAAAVAINRRITAAETAREIFEIVERVRERAALSPAMPALPTPVLDANSRQKCQDWFIESSVVQAQAPASPSTAGAPPV